MSVWIAAASWSRVIASSRRPAAASDPGGVLAAGGEVGAQRRLAVPVDGFQHPVGVVFDETATQQGCSRRAGRR